MGSFPQKESCLKNKNRQKHTLTNTTSLFRRSHSLTDPEEVLPLRSSWRPSPCPASNASYGRLRPPQRDPMSLSGSCWSRAARSRTDATPTDAAAKGVGTGVAPTGWAQRIGPDGWLGVFRRGSPVFRRGLDRWGGSRGGAATLEDGIRFAGGKGRGYMVVPVGSELRVLELEFACDHRQLWGSGLESEVSACRRSAVEVIHLPMSPLATDLSPWSVGHGAQGKRRGLRSMAWRHHSLS